MRKSKGFIALVLVITIQISTLIGAVIFTDIDKKLMVKKGTLVQLPVEAVYYMNEYLYFDFVSDRYSEYKKLVKISDGSYALETCDKKPDGDLYIKDIDEQCFYIGGLENHQCMDAVSKKKLTKDEILFDNEDVFDDAVLTGYVYKGRLETVEVKIDGISAEEYFREIGK